MANINDVARLSGVSKTTVSRVINQYPHISKKKKDKVLQAMEQLGYTPNLSARRLRGQLTTTIAVVVPRIVNPFFSYLVDAIEKVGFRNGYQTLICQSSENKDKELTFLKLLKTKQADGIILTAIENDWSLIEPYNEYGPIVLCNEYVRGGAVPMVRLDHFKGTYTALQYLIGKGHKKIAYCLGGQAIEGDDDRYRGYCKVMEEYGLKINPAWILTGKLTVEDGKQIVNQLDAMEDKPTAIFTNSDEVASGLLNAAKKHGYAIPGDLAIIGFDDQPVAQLLEPTLTTIRQPIEDMGRIAAELLMQKLNQPEMAPRTVELPFEFVIREST